MPQVLKKLMRHESIKTAMKYHVGRNAETAVRMLWENRTTVAEGHTTGNNRDSAAVEITALKERKHLS
jgi:hypothetical protein